MKQLDPKAVWLFSFSFVLSSFIPIIIFSIWVGGFLADNASTVFVDGVREVQLRDSAIWILLVALALIIVCFIWAKLTYRFYRYELAENGFKKESGVIYKKYVTIPYDRIQNVDIYRGILARLLGLSDLHIQTAGGSGYTGGYGGITEGRLVGLSKEVAEQLRDEVIARARQSKNQGL
ncbi:hypothetical protein A3G53_02795 [Candidatus Nomurabacteria bacterium RIFCSPLOWO2_12_FULL_44_11]|uniref:YdbS-like PH domain-containing protein n=1 Tax=Candidatus Nomurabacteria bacterium RIFCSPLOWO2_12_FULL_44_11 TaxID=1801796 RepID=A0A1F6Y3I6_9BACT|nr:MAG: hypothetical protein A3E95_00070 [Candidatus Nomurabacteria bacterium RIFCSPHIGHO2_12_FULL_44_22b]OGJ00951.1 MAG: hypothetical protein A3G53_02795 [Candidatus Nomurabacteria bacterium RIFCSPLOWO2_12_FULL_44_11]